MISGTLLLIGRRSAQSDGTIETHAERLRERDVAETVRVERYDDGVDGAEPSEYADLDAEPVYVMPMTVARTNETKHAILTVVSSVTDSAILCDPIGRSPVVTDILADRAADRVEPAADASVVLVGLGSSSLPQQRRVLEYHETRLAERTPYGEVTSAYLLQDPVVECARYNVSNDRVVAVPVFVAPSTATREEIPDKLGLDRGGIEYADPIGTHPRLTDAIEVEVTKRHLLASGADDDGPVGSDLLGPTQAVATDGRGSSR